VTRGVRVRASVVFAPEESNEAVFTFAYRRGHPAAVTMSVAALGSATAHACMQCNSYKLIIIHIHIIKFIQTSLCLIPP